MTIDEILIRSTTTPARLFGLSDSLGSLKEGYLADIAIFKVCEGEFEFVDSMKESRVGKQKLKPVAVIRAGKIYGSNIYLEGRSRSGARK
jgi:predicted amidohydrolase